MRKLEEGLACWACGRGDFEARVVTSAMMKVIIDADNAASQVVTRARYCGVQASASTTWW